MVTKRLSALAGFILLIGCIVGIVILIYGGGSSRSSGKNSAKESFTGWEEKERRDSITASQPSLQEVNQLADELQKLFSKSSSGGTRSSSGQRTSTPTLKSPSGVEQKTNKALDVKSVKKTLTENENDDGNRVSHSPWPASTHPKLIPFQPPPASETESNQVYIINTSTRPTQRSSQLVTGTSTKPTVTDWEQDEEDDSDISEEEDANENDQEISEREDQPRNPFQDLGQLFDLATDLYATGVNSSDIRGFLRVINDTVNQGNSSRLLTQLNDLYTRPGSAASLSPDLFVGRNAYESSVTAFVFMSFGIFLLNQIHGLIARENKSERGVARKLDETRQWRLSSNSLDASELDMLFQPPRSPGNLSTYELGSRNNSENHMVRDSSWTMDHNGDNDTSALSSIYVNNMFRALLNLVNAYTKNSRVLECIWSLYCQDLDKTAAKQGLYGIAARINSIGLRLIMDQIPTELTLEVMLRSLLGWDGLPCVKMFPKCQLENAVMALKAATSGNSPQS